MGEKSVRHKGKGFFFHIREEKVEKVCSVNMLRSHILCISICLIKLQHVL